ncbi:hypothetical protein ACM66B_002297 [Microbotryomycetes sp. NB124-2]
MLLPWDTNVSSDSESEPECEVRWAVKNVLDLDKHRQVQPRAQSAVAAGPSSITAAATTTPYKQASTKAAPEVVAKRTTNAAELPSPSAATDAKPLRARKQRRSSARHSGAASPLDANTLRLVGELAKRLNENKSRSTQQQQQQHTPQSALRPKSVNSPASVSTSMAAAAAGSCKVTRSSHLRATHLPTPTSMPRGNVASNLSLLASKPNLQGGSPVKSTRSRSLTSNTSSSTAATSVSTKATDEPDEFDALLNADDETSFELALTQFDERQVAKSAPAAVVNRKPALAPRPAPPQPALTGPVLARASPRLASRSMKTHTAQPVGPTSYPKGPIKSVPQIQHRDMFSSSTPQLEKRSDSRPAVNTLILEPRRPLARTESSKSRTELPQDEVDELFNGVETGTWNDDDF